MTKSFPDQMTKKITFAYGRTGGSPAYAKIANTVPYFCGFGLCTPKWGILGQ